MKSYLPLVAIAAFLISCSTAYQTGQTPDDVYYSPERATQDEYVQVEKKSSRQYRNDRYDYDERDERLARMRLYNRLFTTLDDDWYYYDMYSRYRGNYIGYYTPLNYSYYWNYNYNPYFTPYYNYRYSNYYNPYGAGYVIVEPRNVYNKPRTYNLLVFDREMNNVNPNLPKGYRGSNVGYRDNSENYRGSGSNAGDFLRNVFSSGNSGGGVKISAPSSSSGSGSSGSSSSSGSGSSNNSSRGRATRGGN